MAVRTISSPLTPLSTCVPLATPLVIGIVAAVAALFVHGPRAHELLAPLIVAPILSGWAWLTTVQWIKVVKLDENRLIVSNCLKTITVPLSEVDTVRDIDYGTQHHIQIWFRRPTDFGYEVRFIPEWTYANPHGLIAELEELVRAACAKGP